LGSGLRRLSDCVVDLSGFEGDDEIDVNGKGSGQLDRQCEKGLEIIVNLFCEFDQNEARAIEKKLRDG
jgi:hypothetical protein